MCLCLSVSLFVSESGSECLCLCMNSWVLLIQNMLFCLSVWLLWCECVGVCVCVSVWVCVYVCVASVMEALHVITCHQKNSEHVSILSTNHIISNHNMSFYQKLSLETDYESSVALMRIFQAILFYQWSLHKNNPAKIRHWQLDNELSFYLCTSSYWEGAEGMKGNISVSWIAKIIISRHLLWRENQALWLVSLSLAHD